MRRPPSRLTDWLTSLLLIGGIAVGGAPRAAEEPAPALVRDLYYGEVLFHFYRQDDFTALTHLLAARDTGRVPHHEAEAELLLGGLYLGYGQHARAEAIFERLLAGETSATVRDRAWFYLGKLRYQRGLHAEALASFARIGGSLPEALTAELPMLVAQCHLAQGDFAGAERVLAAWDAPGGWAAYARYNLGVALVRLGRLEEGAAALDRVGRMDADNAEEKSLRDKANLALGYARLQVNDAAAARTVLQRVRLRGPFASKALLGVGWADAAAGDYQGALVPWFELTDRDPLDSAVQESFLAVPYALGRLEAHAPAVARYQRALGSFDTEIGRIDAAVARARAGSLVPALLAGDEPDLARWYWRLERVPVDEDSRYLHHLMADHGFQEGVKNYRDLAALSRNLADWRQRLDTFAAMVEARSAAHAGQVPAARARLATVDLDALRARRAALAARVEAATAGRDVVAVASETERDQWRRLEALAALPDLRAGGDPALRERHRVLRGVLAWDLDRRFRERAWRAQRSLRELDAALAEADTRRAAVVTAENGEPSRFTAFAGRIAALAPRIDTLRAAVDVELGTVERQLVALAVAELDAGKQRLASYRVQARFALATLYDRAGAAQAAAERSGARP